MVVFDAIFCSLEMAHTVGRNHKGKCEIGGSHGSDHKDYCPLGCTQHDITFLKTAIFVTNRRSAWWI